MKKNRAKKIAKKVLNSITEEILGRWYSSPLTFSETRRQMYGLLVFPKRVSEKQLYNAVGRISRHGWVEKKKINDQTYYALTKEGRIRYTILKLKTFRRRRGSQATIALFDIPEEKRTYRNFIRRLLGQMGFTRLQRSVFITPYILPKEFYDLLREMKILHHFLFIEGRINFKK